MIVFLHLSAWKQSFCFFSVSLLVVCVWHSPIKINLSSALNLWRQISHTRFFPSLSSPDKTKTNFRFFLQSSGRHRSNLNLRAKELNPLSVQYFHNLFPWVFFSLHFFFLMRPRDKGGNHLLIYHHQTSLEKQTRDRKFRSALTF